MKKLILLFLITIFCTYLSGQDDYSSYFVYNTEIHEFEATPTTPCKVTVHSGRKGVVFYNTVRNYVKWVSIDAKTSIHFDITGKEEKEDEVVLYTIDMDDMLYEIRYTGEAIFIREWFTGEQIILYYED